MSISTRRRRRLLGLGTLMMILLLACPWSSQAAWMPYPGLPEPTVEPGSWYWVQQAGMSETAKAKQYVAVPPLTLASFGGSVPTGTVSEPGVLMNLKVGGDAAFVSPPGAPAPYGYMPPMRVRTVGFGLLPAEATIQISQRRSANGEVVPVHAEVNEKVLLDRTEIYAETVVEDAFDVRITQVLVDGVDIGLTGNCRTARPAPVRMVGPTYTVPGEYSASVASPAIYAAYLKSLGEENYFNPIMGGQLSGSIDIPPFIGCTTRNGDDISPMLTLSASGPGNRVVARARPCIQESSGGRPPAPGDWDKFPFPDPGSASSGCKPYEPDELVPYPERGSG